MSDGDRSEGTAAVVRFRAVGPLDADRRAVAYRLDGSATLVDEAGLDLLPVAPRFRWIHTTDVGARHACTDDGVFGLLEESLRFRPDPDSEESEARLELARIGRLLYERDYNASIDGNLSFRLQNGSILMSPSGAHLGCTSPADFVVTDATGRLLRGARSPSSEFRLHVDVLKARPDCRSVIHVHAPYALAASVAGVDLHKTYISVAPIPTTAYARISSPETPAVLRPYLEHYNWAIIPRHGIATWADSPWNAFLRVEGLEHCAKVLMLAGACGPVDPMPREKADELLRFWNLDHVGVAR